MAQATTGTLKGKLVDSTGKQSLKDASVTLLDPKDSTLELYGLAKEDGSFDIGNISFGSYLMHIVFQGYEPVFKLITLSKISAELKLGNIYLKLDALYSIVSFLIVIGDCVTVTFPRSLNDCFK